MADPLFDRIKARLEGDDELAAVVLLGRKLEPKQTDAYVKHRQGQPAPQFGISPAQIDATIGAVSDGIAGARGPTRPRSLEQSAKAALERQTKELNDAARSAGQKIRDDDDIEPGVDELVAIEADDDVDLSDLSEAELSAWLAEGEDNQSEGED